MAMCKVVFRGSAVALLFPNVECCVVLLLHVRVSRREQRDFLRAAKPRNPRHFDGIEGKGVYQRVFVPKQCLTDTYCGTTIVSDTFFFCVHAASDTLFFLPPSMKRITGLGPSWSSLDRRAWARRAWDRRAWAGPPRWADRAAVAPAPDP